MKLSKEIKTAIIALAGIFLFILGFSYLKSNPLFDDNITLYAVYNNVGGLQAGTPVTINGFTVGNVNNIEFKDNVGNLLVTFTVGTDFRFSKNSSVELYDTGIIGGKGLQIKPVFDGARAAEANDTLVSSTRPGITDIVQQKLAPLQMKVEGAVSNADSLLMNVNDVLDERTKNDLRKSIQGLSTLVASFQKSADAMNGILENNKGNLDSSLTNIKNISKNFSVLSDSLSEANLPATLQKLHSSMAHLDAVLGKMDRGNGTMGKMVNNEDLYDHLSEASRQLELLLQDFRLNPKRYVNVSVFGKKQKDYTLPENDPAEEIDDQN